MSEANVFYTVIKNVNYPSKDEIRGVKVGSKVGSSDTHPVDIYGTSKRLSREDDLINRIPSGRGHACFLEKLIFNDL